ncbi:putative ABC-type phosphate transporter [Helianthus anomalus]
MGTIGSILAHGFNIIDETVVIVKLIEHNALYHVLLNIFFANFGPNSTTFVVPAEISPARLCSTCHGISAATGKAGAIVGSYGFLYSFKAQTQKRPTPVILLVSESGTPSSLWVWSMH